MATPIDELLDELRDEGIDEELDLDEKESSALLARIKKMNEENEELKKNPDQKDVDKKMQDLAEKLVAAEARVTELEAEQKDTETLTNELELTVIGLRKVALNAYAKEAGLSEYSREDDESYLTFKKTIEKINSPSRLIQKIAVYDTLYDVNGNIEGRKTYSHAEDGEDEMPRPLHYPTRNVLGI